MGGKRKIVQSGAVQAGKSKKQKAVTKTKALPLRKPKISVKVLSKDVNYSLCIPTNVLDQCKNLEQITNVVYQIAKAATYFNVGEIVVLNTDELSKNHDKKKKLSNAMLIVCLLQYFVTPPYLLKTLFKKEYQSYFKYASKLQRLSSLPFMRYYEENKGRYREGLAIKMAKPTVAASKNKGKEFKQTKFINVGEKEALELKSQVVPVNVRVTVDTVEKKVVSPQEAYGDYVGANSSFGYHTRIANAFSNVFSDCAFKNGYSQAVWVNSGDFFYNENLKKNKVIENELCRLEKIVRSPAEAQAATPANLLLVYGKWDHIKKSFEQSKHHFEGCEGPHQFFDAQLQLPGAPQGMVPIHDSCMMSLSLLSTF